MTDEPNNKNLNDDGVLPKDEPLDDDNVIKLKPEQYSALLERIQELEEGSKRSKVYSLDDLAEEAKGKSGRATEARKPDKDINDMSRLELAQYIVNVIGDHFTPVANDLQVQIQTIKVAQEIDRTAAKYDDFWDLHEDILRIGTENPSLSIEKAYKLAKAERGETPSKKSSKDKTLLTLPPKPVLGDKPNMPSRSQTTPKVMSLTEAAEKAWADAGVTEAK